MKIRTMTIIVIISTNFVIILLSILAGTGYVRENIEKYIEADMMVVADMADRFISSELDLLRYEASSAAEHLSESAPSNWNRVLAAEARRYPKFAGMAVLSWNGVLDASAGERPASPDLLKNTSIQRAFYGGKAFTSTVADESGGVAFYLAVPIPRTAEHILVLTLDGMHFSDLAAEYHIWKTGHIFIDDKDGYIIANIRPEWVRDRQNFILLAQRDPQYKNIAAVIENLVAGNRGIDYYSMNGVSRICAYRPISGSPEGWCLGIVAPLSESPVRGIDRGLFVIVLVGFLLNVVAAIIASNFIRKPFESVAALREAAEASSLAKSNFLATMSHEIRTPLNAVVGLSELMLDNDKLESETKDRLEKICGAGTTILSIVNDILDISKIESGKFELYPVQYDTPSFINDTVILNIVRIGEKNIVFKLYVDENIPGKLYGDDLRVKQIFNNLLSNAFKYTHEGMVEWRVSFEREGEDVWLVSSVRDTGMGIKPEDVQKLFSDYNQVDTRTNRKVEGTGLGLAITRRLVDMMDGTITVESEYGKGTAFHVRLRQAIASDTPIGEEIAGNLMNMRYTLSRRAGKTKHGRVNLSYAHVLVVDDVVTNLDVAKGMMKPYKVNIDCALSGQEAIDMIRKGEPKYSAIFMDHMMPGMDGIEAARIIREDIGTEHARKIPIIALTANAIVGNSEMFLNNGFQDFVSKPIDMMKLDAVLRTWVRNRELEKQLAPAGEEAALSGSGSPDSENITSPLSGIRIEGIDKGQALESFDGDEDIFIDVMRSYATNTRPFLITLKEYLQTGNMEDYAIVVHGIKGASYGVFAQEVGDAARVLELAAKAGNLEAVKAGHGAFEKTVEALIAVIDEVLVKVDDR